MKEIECPSCGQMIPDDSRFCDMCGVELLECINCGTLGTDNFCPECGKPMVARQGTTDSDDDSGKQLILKSRNGNITLQPEPDAIIGRNDSPYASALSEMNLISRRHGEFVRRGHEWYIVDFGSTNGTYVNNREVLPNTPVKIVPGDVVDIGTYIFDVLKK